MDKRKTGPLLLAAPYGCLSLPSTSSLRRQRTNMPTCEVPPMSLRPWGLVSLIALKLFDRKPLRNTALGQTATGYGDEICNYKKKSRAKMQVTAKHNLKTKKHSDMTQKGQEGELPASSSPRNSETTTL